MAKKLLGLREYARHRGVHHRAIQAAVESGRLTPTYVKGRPKFDPAVHDRQLDLSTDPSKQNRTGRPPPKPAKEKGRTSPAAADEPPARNGAAATYASSRAVRETYNARLAKLDFESKSGKLIPADQVKTDAYRTARTVRDALMNVPDRISAKLAAMSGIPESSVHDLISTEIRAALEELVNAQQRKSET